MDRAPGVTFSADGKRIASAGSTEVHIWEADTGKPVKVLKGHTKDVLCVAFAPKSPDLLLSGGADKKYMMWDVTKDKPTHTSEDVGAAVVAVAFSADERFVGMADATGGAVVYATNKWDKLVYGAKVIDTKGLKMFGFTRDASGLIAGGDGGQLKVVGGPGGPESALGNTIATLSAHTGAVGGQGTTPDGKLLASVADDLTVIVWELPIGRQIRAYQTEKSAKRGTCLAVRPDGRQIAAGFDLAGDFPHRLADSTGQRTKAELVELGAGGAVERQPGAIDQIARPRAAGRGEGHLAPFGRERGGDLAGGQREQPGAHRARDVVHLGGRFEVDRIGDVIERSRRFRRRPRTR